MLGRPVVEASQTGKGYAPWARGGRATAPDEEPEGRQWAQGSTEMGPGASMSSSASALTPGMPGRKYPEKLWHKGELFAGSPVSRLAPTTCSSRSGDRGVPQQRCTRRSRPRFSCLLRLSMLTSASSCLDEGVASAKEVRRGGSSKLVRAEVLQWLGDPPSWTGTWAGLVTAREPGLGRLRPRPCQVRERPRARRPKLGHSGATS